MKLFELFDIQRYLILLLLISNLGGCALQPKNNFQITLPAVPFANSEHFGSKPELTQIDDIFTLSEEQLADFNGFFNSNSNKSTPANKKIYKYLQQYVKNYSYFNKTLTAQQSLHQAQGNCLSLAILTTALAKIAGIDTGYQLIQSTPIYQKEGNIIIGSQHVRSLLYSSKLTPSEGVVFLSRPGIAIDYFPTSGSHIKRMVLEPEFHAMYYRNSAADALINEDFDLAYWLLREALNLSPSDEHSINMMAIVHQKKGLDLAADSLYMHGLKYSADKLNLLRNYYHFLRKQQRFSEARHIKTKLATMKTVNPFDWINLGHTAFTQDKFTEAKRYYKKALKMAPYLHQGHLGVAKSEFKLGNIRASKKSMLLAKKNAFDLKTKELYQHKMNSLAKY